MKNENNNFQINNLFESHFQTIKIRLFGGSFLLLHIIKWLLKEASDHMLGYMLHS